MVIRNPELIIRGLDQNDRPAIICGRRGRDMFIDGRYGINHVPD